MSNFGIMQAKAELQSLAEKPRPLGRRTTALVARVLTALEPNSLPPINFSAADVRERIRAFQERSGLQATGAVNEETLFRLHAEVSQLHVSTSRMRTARVQEMLGKAGFVPDGAETDRRLFGDSTSSALKQFQDSVGLTADGLADDTTVAALTNRALEVTLSTKTQIAKLQRSILRAARVRGLQLSIDGVEMKARDFGPSTQAAVSALQARLGLPPTGVVDAITFERLRTTAASINPPGAKVGKPDPSGVQRVAKKLRLNMTNKHVPTLQKTLAFLGHPCDESEFKAARFGPSTRKAVLAFQAARGLPQTGAVDPATLRSINAAVAVANPGTAPSARIRGSVRDEAWAGRADVTVELRTNPILGEGVLLGSRGTLSNGFYDLPYTVPTNWSNGRPVTPLAVRVTFTSNGQLLGAKDLLNPTPIAWVNFTQGPYPYQGPSQFEVQLSALNAAGIFNPGDLVETPERPEVTRTATTSGLSQDEVMRLVLAWRTATELNAQALDAQMIYAFLSQSLPPALPDDLLAQTHDWTLIDQLTDQVAVGIVFTDPDLQDRTLDIALEQNLVSITLAARRDAIRSSLLQARRIAALDRPLLVGNGTLRALLGLSTIPAGSYDAVADAFVVSGGLGERFWEVLRNDPATFGGDGPVADLEVGVDVGLVTKNYVPMVTLVRERIEDVSHPELRSSRDLAKLTTDEWVTLINDGGGTVPEGTDGTDEEQRRRTYAQTMASQSERLYPSVALTAEIARSTATALTQVAEIRQLIDDHPDLELRQTNIDMFIAQNNLVLAQETRSELQVLQRVHRLSPTSTTARALLDSGLHSSVQLVALGAKEVVRRLTAAGVTERAALTVQGYAEFQYAQVLQRLGEFRSELQGTNPAALAPQTLTVEQRTALLSEIPDLDLLFGPLDVCDCPHCASVYGPAAYLADLLRFLDAHRAETGDRTVRAVLAERRPDLEDVLLDCPNTETPLPQIDIVNEILEAAVPGSAGQQGNQTTRTAAELRAAPEHEDDSVYEVLRTADFPLTSAFDLWQEQARIFLDHLGVPRWQLMESFRVATVGNSDIAAEYFGISTHEQTLITTAEPQQARQDVLWDFDTSRSQIPVLEILEHANLGYPELLLTLQTHWITPEGDSRVVLVRPADSAALAAQSLDNLSPAVLDRMHRLLRLRRHVPWDIWELDLLLRADRLDGGDLDGVTLATLLAAAKVGHRLQLTAEQLATWFGTLPTEGHPGTADPADRSQDAKSAYVTRFLDRAVTDPTDPAFDPLPAGGSLDAHRPALLAALVVTDAELTALQIRIGNVLDLATLSALVSWTGLARSLRLSVSDLLLLANLLTPVLADPFASPSAMGTFLDAVDELRGSGASVAETDYLLASGTTSPLSAPDETVAGLATTLREGLRTNPSEDTAGQVASSLAGPLRLTPDVVALLLAQSDIVGPLLDPFLDAAFTARDDAGAYQHPVTAAAFPRLFFVYRRLQKMARVVELTGMDGGQLNWQLAHGPGLGTLALQDLPVDAPPVNPLVSGWLKLLRWRRVRAALLLRSAAAATLPGGSPAAPNKTPEDLIVAAAAPGATVAEARVVAEPLLGMASVSLAILDGGDVAGYLDPAFLLRLLDCSGQATRIGVPAMTCLGWAQPDSAAPTEREVATQIRSAAKSKHDTAAWLVTVTPIQDTLRERKRDALVGYLLSHAARTEPDTVSVGGQDWANPKRWRGSDDLLRYFLIDVEMTSCQQTSRIKAAIGSIQMFVQRAFLNLEKPHVIVTSEERADAVSLDSWRHWKWMKSYRVWEANRKIFFYPENWIAPELRDDKTPFFTELEQEVLQSDITSENCETALRHYLEKVHEVSNLDVVGIHHEVQDDHPWDNLPPTVNIMHVIGRTRSEPATYFYRQFDLNDASWSSWEKIDLDISTDQVVPVVYNRMLHLFWLQIAEKPQKNNRQPPAQTNNTTQRAPEPPRQIELRIAWSVRSGKGWSARKVAPQVLVHPWQRPVSSYSLKPRYRSVDNLLWLDIYISMSLEFNNQQFWDPYSGLYDFATSRRFDETARPWHSSSFIFDGQVTELRLKPLLGQYHTLDGAGVPSEALVATDSYRYVRGLTDPTGKRIKPLQGGGQVAPRMMLPDGMHLESGRLVNNTWTPNNGTLTVLQSGNNVSLLTGAKPPFAVVYSMNSAQFDTASGNRSPFFYVDAARAYFVQSSWADVFIDSTTTARRLKYSFSPFHHPYIALFLRELNRSGADGLLNRKIQRFPEQYPPGNSFTFASYAPVAATTAADPNAVRDKNDFSRSGAMSIYNWEIFFHVPFLIACKLMANQRFEEALEWFHRVFDPTNTEALSAPQRFWVTLPFFEQNDEAYRRQRIESLLADISSRLDEVRAWKNNPFNPDVIARYRPIAYQKAVVMRYIDNLIAWGDQLFRRDTIESINEATLLYVLAGELLGRRPEHVAALPRPAKSYAQLTAESTLDPLGNAQVEVQLENLADRPTIVVASTDGIALPVINLSYFGIPANTDLLAYWDTVADRLYKVRHCMDLSGTVRQLPLFEPPIDPAILVRAAAAGVDLDSMLADTPGAGSPYRFQTLLAKAVEFTADVRALGDRMLAALDRRDAEALVRLQASNDVALQTAITDVRTAQVLETQRARESIELGRATVQARIDYYAAIPYMNPWEIGATVVHGAGVISEIAATVLNAVSGGASLVPDLTFGVSGFGGSPMVVAKFGGTNVADSASKFANLFQGISSILHSTGSMLETQGNYRRQADSNQFQADAARKELAQLEKQVIAAQARESIAAFEHAAHETLVEHAKGIEEYLKTKYTNTELYDWTIRQLSTVYFQAYQLAFDMARRAERAYRFELGDHTSAPVIQFGYWDSLKKGLMAGDRLLNDLRRLEATHLEHNTRQLEATSHISLATLMPDKLLELKTSGTTSIELSEWLLATEHPGWINQRILSVAVTVPCTSAPYAGVHAGLKLTQAVIRRNDSTVGGFGNSFDAGDDRFVAAMSPVTGIVTSHASVDRGSFGYTSGDDRYTAFEGAGLISRWTITLDPRDNAFDVSSVTDIVLSFDYQGEQGGPALVDAARLAIDSATPTNGARLFALDSAFVGEWFQFLHPDAGAEQKLRIAVQAEDLPFLYRRMAHRSRLSVTQADLVILSDHTGQFDCRIAPPGQGLPTPTSAPHDPTFGGMHHVSISWPAGTQNLLGGWQVAVKRDTDSTWDALPEDLIEHAWLLLQFGTP